ncbi:MAG: hypothetical protein K6L80_11240 [Agarilytica sp.]
MKKLSSILAAVTILVSLSSASFAGDIGYGVGLTWMPQNGFSVGARIFSDDEEDNAVASVGVDYAFKTKSLRPAVGIAYLGDSTYGEFSLGYDLGEKEINYGFGVGYADTAEDAPIIEPEDDIPETDLAQ